VPQALSGRFLVILEDSGVLGLLKDASRRCAVACGHP
jgi:hypothetical protein